MVAQLLRLKLRLFANGFRRPVGAIILSALGLAIAVTVVVLLVQGAEALQTEDDAFVRRVTIIIGSYLSLAAFLLPFMLVRSELLDPRGLRAFRFRSATVAIMILVLSLIGPLILIAPIAWAPTTVWRDPEAIRIAQLAAPLLFLQGLLSVRLGVAAGAALANNERWSRRVRFIGAPILILGLIPVLTVALPRLAASPPPSSRGFFVWLLQASAYVRNDNIAEALVWSPWGVLWAAPSHSVMRDPAMGPQALWIGVILTLCLLAMWFVAVRLVFRATRRIPVARRGGVPGWFRRLPSSPTGAIAARSFTYWVRDPRYRAVLGFLPFVPLVVLAASFIGGIPLAWASLIPLPLVIILLALATTHNDVAYDSTAVWAHIAAQTSGSHDRLGRLAPVLALGVILIIVGAPLSAWGYGDIEILPAVVGVNLALLLGGAGVASGISSRLPYAAPRPGDPAFQQPQVQGSTGTGAQALALLGTVAVAAPSLVLTALWMLDPWFSGNWIALIVGAQAGLVALAVGIQLGGDVFERRGPELLAFTMRH